MIHLGARSAAVSFTVLFTIFLQLRPKRFDHASIYHAGFWPVPIIHCRPRGGTQMGKRASFLANSFMSLFVLAALVLVGLTVMVQGGRSQSTNQDSPLPITQSS